VPIGAPSMARNFGSIVVAVWFAAVAFVCCVAASRGDPLTADVRNVREYALALREGQRPPLVAPTLEGGRRPAVFQYYSGTAYTLPGLLARRGVDPAVALKVAVFLHALAGGGFVYLACRAAGRGTAASVAAGTVYLAITFVVYHRLRPWGYTDFAAWAVAPLVFYLGLRMLRAARRWDRRRWFCLIALALAYFIPLQPVQAVVSGCVVFALLAAVAVLDPRTRCAGPARLVVALACGAAASAWFWLPLVSDRGATRVTADPSFPGHVADAAPDEAHANLFRADGTLDVNAAPLTRIRDRRHARFWTEIAGGKEGRYRLPVYFLPSAEVLVNGQRVRQPPSPAGQPMVVVPLRAGPNLITIRTRPSTAAWRISVAACVALVLGALLAAFVARPMPSVSVRHL
jgi:hypothetical protein